MNLTDTAWSAGTDEARSGYLFLRQPRHRHRLPPLRQSIRAYSWIRHRTHRGGGITASALLLHAAPENLAACLALSSSSASAPASQSSSPDIHPVQRRTITTGTGAGRLHLHQLDRDIPRLGRHLPVQQDNGAIGGRGIQRPGSVDTVLTILSSSSFQTSSSDSSL